MSGHLRTKLVVKLHIKIFLLPWSKIRYAVGKLSVCVYVCVYVKRQQKDVPGSELNFYMQPGLIKEEI